MRQTREKWRKTRNARDERKQGKNDEDIKRENDKWIAHEEEEENGRER